MWFGILPSLLMQMALPVLPSFEALGAGREVAKLVLLAALITLILMEAVVPTLI